MKRSFSWEHFDFNFIKSIVYSSKTKEAFRPKYDFDKKELLVPYINKIATDPSSTFIKQYKGEIIDNFFADSVHLVNISKALENKRYRNINSNSMNEMLGNLKKLRLTDTVLTLMRNELYKHGKQLNTDDEVSIFTYPKSIDLKSCITQEISLHDYQKSAVDELVKCYLKEDKGAGILVMPTGSGKTRVAAYFLLKEMISNGFQVIWLTHRSMLIEQTADAMYSMSPIIKLRNKEAETFKMVCISGQHSSVCALEKDDDLMIFSVQSLCRNLDYLKAVIRKKVIVVVDEAHHTYAPSYQLIINAIREMSPKMKLLGLTATPVRMSENSTASLMKLFNNEIIYSIDMSTLITNKTLAEPHYISVDTNIDFDTKITVDEKAYIKKWKELSPDLLSKVAQTAERNEIIVDTYLKNRDKYGKTLIFALNAMHCISLCEALQEKGVKCDYIYCAHSGNEEKIARFKSGELEVLVNINIMTEGSDVPDIESVFLTRPTSSDVLLMQMIGRGMRGKSFGGTEIVNIVDFHDNWGSFINWLNPRFILNTWVEETTNEVKVMEGMESEMIPWAMVRELFDSISVNMKGQSETCTVVPSGWFDILDEEGNDIKILTFECQLAGYIAMRKDLKNIINNVDIDGQYALDKYFNTFGWMPSAYELQLIIDFIRINAEMPYMYPMVNRKKVDVACIGERLKLEDARLSEIEAEIQKVFEDNTAVIESLYGSRESFSQRVNDYIRYPNGIKPIGSRIEELPSEFLTLDTQPIYDLDEMVEEVINEMFNGIYLDRPPVAWTDKCFSTYFGVYNYPLDNSIKNKDSIKINRILNSKDVNRETVKYVIYHELLHKENHAHNKAFRELEHRYPNYTEHEKFLKFTFPKFELDYAL